MAGVPFSHPTSTLTRQRHSTFVLRSLDQRLWRKWLPDWPVQDTSITPRSTAMAGGVGTFDSFIAPFGTPEQLRARTRRPVRLGEPFSSRAATARLDARFGASLLSED